MRPGNENDTVNVHYLMMRGSFDASSHNLVQTKKGWNEAIWDKEVADVISTEEEMGGGFIPPQKQIALQLEGDPEQRRLMEIQFQHESLHAQLKDLRAEHFAVTRRLRKKEDAHQTAKIEVAQREKKLAKLTPNPDINDPAKRAEAFKKSKAHAQRLLESAKRRGDNALNTWSKTHEQLQRVETEIQTLQRDIETFEKTHFAQEDTSPPHYRDVVETLGAADKLRLNAVGQRMFGEEWFELREKILTPTGREVMGRYQNGWAEISTGKGDPESTLYHEAYHRAEDLFPDRQRTHPTPERHS